jgi:hypothetical protein
VDERRTLLRPRPPRSVTARAVRIEQPFTVGELSRHGRRGRLRRGPRRVARATATSAKHPEGRHGAGCQDAAQLEPKA